MECPSFPVLLIGVRILDFVKQGSIRCLGAAGGAIDLEASERELNLEHQEHLLDEVFGFHPSIKQLLVSVYRVSNILTQAQVAFVAAGVDAARNFFSFRDYVLVVSIDHEKNLQSDLIFCQDD